MILPPEMEAAAKVRRQEIADHFQPSGPYAEWLVARMAFASVQLDRCQQMTLEDITYSIRRAERFWDVDRTQQAAELAARLPKDPQRVAPRLRQTRQGAQWMIDQWEDLGDSLDVRDTWDDTQRGLAFDMLGVHPALRNGFRRVPEPSNRAGLVALVQREVERLRGDQEHALDSSIITSRSSPLPARRSGRTPFRRGSENMRPPSSGNGKRRTTSFWRSGPETPPGSPRPCPPRRAAPR